jgi:hypothetical protein
MSLILFLNISAGNVLLNKAAAVFDRSRLQFQGDSGTLSTPHAF